MKAQKKRELFKEFLEKNKVLLVDKSSASRRRLMKTLVEMGCKRNQIFSVAHYTEALEIVKTEKPKLVLSDFSIKGGSGFDLFKEYREMEKELNDTTLILVTSNISQSAVAKAAEEDVDSFIIKPYTVKSLEKSLITAVINKLYPSKYMKTIDEGKKLLFDGDYKGSLEIFEKAKTMTDVPSLAYFYHGQAKTFLELAEEAKGDYKKGLEVNKIHFKCQIGLFELFMKEKKYFEAYDVVKNIAKYFPANPDRLKQVVRLAVLTENYEDMIDYYEIFTELEERPSEVVNYMCSGLYVLGRYRFFNNDKVSGKDIFEKITTSCMGEEKFLKAMITKYVEEKMYAEAKEVLKRYPTDIENQSWYLVSRYLAHSSDMTVNQLVSDGLELFNNGHEDPLAAEIMIKALFNSGSKKAQHYLDEAKHKWPEIFGNLKIPSVA